jgi:HPr kinase/phosphorylase
MTPPRLTARDLFDTQSAPLKLKWVAGRAGGDRLLEPATARYPGMALVGHLNFVHPNRVQVIGVAELDYLKRLNARARAAQIQSLCGYPATAAIAVANNARAPADLKQVADERNLALFTSPLPSPVLIERLQHYLTRALAPKVTVHGVYMEVLGMGVLITGESGIGKSELALELLSRNHRLIADDAVEFIRVGPDVLVGQSPGATLSDYLEVRGLGILDIRTMFGETAVRHRKRLHLIVRMERLDKRRLRKLDRLQAHQLTRTLLDIDIPEVALFVGPGRNLAVLVEAAVRSYILRMWGIDTLKDFMQRQQSLIDRVNS